MKKSISYIISFMLVFASVFCPLSEPVDATDGNFIISRSSITLIKGQKLDLFLFDQNKDSIEAYVLSDRYAEVVADGLRTMNGVAYKNLPWKSSNSKIASVSKNGTIKANKPGKAKIIVKYKDKTYKCKVKVVKSLSSKQRLKLAKKEAKRIVKKYTNNSMSKKQKARILAYYVIKNVGSQLDQSSAKYKKNYGNEAYAALIMHLSACSGRCKAYKMLCDAAGIKCKHVNANKWTHQWNKVYIGGKWIIVDTQYMGGMAYLGHDEALAVRALDLTHMGPVYLKKKSLLSNFVINGEPYYLEKRYI